MYKKQCQDCDDIFYSKSRNTRYCPNCIKKRQSQFAKERNLCKIGGKENAKRITEKKPIKKEKPKKQSICDSYCYGCYYLLGGNDRLMTCDYFEKADKLRPCPAGNGCTAKKTIAQHNAEQKAKENPKTWIVKCGICGKEFETKDKRRKNCSKECLLISRRNASKAQSERLKEERHGKETKPTAGGV